MSLPGLVIDIEARIDKLEKGLKRANAAQSKSASAMEKRSKQSADRMRDAYGDAAKGIEGSFNQLRSSLTSFVAGGGIGAIAGAGVVAGIAAVGASVRNVTRSLAEMGDMAQRAGVGVEEFQEWKFVAEQNRIGVDQMVDGLKELSLRADEFIQTGSGPGAEAFARLGFGAEELARQLHDPSELMLQIIGRMEGLDRAAQIRVADEVFGGAGGERFVELIDQGEAGIRETMQRARDLGLVMDSEVIARAEELDRKFGEITARVGNLFQRIVVGAVEIATVGGEIDNMLTALERIDRLKSGDSVDPEGVTGASAEGLEVIAQAGEAAQVAYDEAAEAASQLAREVDMMVTDLMNAGAVDEAFQLEQAARELDGLVSAWRSNQIEANTFRTEVERVTGEASTLIGTLRGLNGVDLSGIVSRIGAVGNALSIAVSRARAAYAALSNGGAAPLDDGRGGSTGNVANAPTATALAPRSGIAAPPTRPALVDDAAWAEANKAPARPEARPIDFDAPAPSSGGGGGSSPSGGGGGGGGAPEVSDYQREVASLREEIALAEIEAAEFASVLAGGGSLAEAEELAATRAELLHKAQESGLSITPQLRSEIEGLAASYVRAGTEADAAADKLREMEQAGERGARTLSDMMLGIIEGSTTAKQAVAGLLRELLKAQVNRFFLNMAGTATGGGFLSSLGSLLGGARANGGPARAGVPYLINEDTPNSEVFVPSQSGAVLNVSQAQSALRRAAPPRLSGPSLGRSGQVTQQINMPITVKVEGGGSTPAANQDLAARVSRELEVTMRKTVVSELQKQLRPGNLLSRKT